MKTKNGVEALNIANVIYYVCKYFVRFDDVCLSFSWVNSKANYL